MEDILNAPQATSASDVAQQLMAAGVRQSTEPPQEWYGSRSDTRFRAEPYGPMWKLTIHVEAYVPIHMQLLFKTFEILWETAHTFDLLLAIAKNDPHANPVSDKEIVANGMAIVNCLQYWTANASMLAATIDERAEMAEITIENLRVLDANRKSAKLLQASAKRMQDRVWPALKAAGFGHSSFEPVNNTKN